MTTEALTSARPRRGSAVATLAWLEARRMLRSPVLLLAVVACVLLFYSYTTADEWSGAEYAAGLYPVSPLVVASAILAALCFHRERAELADAAPMDETTRGASRLLACLVPVCLTGAMTVALTVWVHAHGGLHLGDEPGFTAHAIPTLPETLQPVAVSVVAVATGAAAGRHFAHRATAILVLSTWYLPVVMFWAFQGPIAPFSLVQSQPIYVDLGPRADAYALPTSWLLSSPTEFQANWARLVVSEQLAWWHLGWLLGLTLLFLALAFGRPLRTRLARIGWVVAGTALVAQYVVYPYAPDAVAWVSGLG